MNAVDSTCHFKYIDKISTISAESCIHIDMHLIFFNKCTFLVKMYYNCYKVTI